MKCDKCGYARCVSNESYFEYKFMWLWNETQR